MTILGLEHYNVLTNDLAGTVAFYREVLGMDAGDRPSFGFPGAWVYAGGRAVLHLVGDPDSPPPGTGSIDHIALEASGYDDVLAVVRTRGLAHRTGDYRPAMNLRQIFIHDPNGVQLELNFRGD